MNPVKVISGEIRKLRDRVSKVEEALKHIPKEIGELETQLDTVRNLLTQKESESLEVVREIRKLEHEFTEVKQKVFYHDKYLRRAESPREYERMIKERDRLTSKAFELNNRIAELRSRYDKLKAEELDLYQKEQALEKELYQKKREYGALLNELRGLSNLLERKVRELEEKFNL
ncbi:hypothetical protein BCF55_0798 [Hydrogenivirga caldilitoris]|uniref:Uncharacterized protein n=1 Tax=Hydrogenivirga caldilitoris TaxID=246264 RepID=A0A497XTR6_9AQUI|nr:hypothetical protein [Hydrogenivirga caldilitoris]RLJ70522.1 hypothetical protein BCF55_0798 [Hydrogenivirga caldilitoris]